MQKGFTNTACQLRAVTHLGIPSSFNDKRGVGVAQADDLFCHRHFFSLGEATRWPRLLISCHWLTLGTCGAGAHFWPHFASEPLAQSTPVKPEAPPLGADWPLEG